jgi:hypothetical protein
VAAVTGLVVTGKEIAVVPAAIVACEGTLTGFWRVLAAPLNWVEDGGVVDLPESITTKPPDGAGPLIVTVPVEPLPPPTLAGLNANPTSVGGSTVSCAIIGAAFPICAEICTEGGFGFTTFGFIATGWV